MLDVRGSLSLGANHVDLLAGLKVEVDLPQADGTACTGHLVANNRACLLVDLRIEELVIVSHLGILRTI